jgi:hypothetical protein
VNPAVCYGRACVHGTRVLVSAVLDNVAAGVPRVEDRIRYREECHSETRDLNTDKGEVGGSSPPRPTIQITSKYAAILTFPLFGAFPQKPFCQPFVNFTIGRMALHSGRKDPSGEGRTASID